MALLSIDQAVRAACLWLPEAEEFMSHGAPNFRVRRKTFATYAVNHHGDGRVALWLPAPEASQENYVRAQPKHFFVPRYVGVRGWLGVRLDRGIAWQQVIGLVRVAYEKVAPRGLIAALGKTPALQAPGKKLTARDLDPFLAPPAKAILSRLHRLCLRYPESSAGTQFGNPVWRAGERTFAMARFQDGRLSLCFWVGAASQALLSAETRFDSPPYFGHRGWIALDASDGCDWQEVASLCSQSYRHFALQRMLRSMGEA